MQEHGRHPELFGPRSLDLSFDSNRDAQVPTDTRYPDPLPPWTDEDTEVLVEFLRHRMEVGSAEWDQLHGKVTIIVSARKWPAYSRAHVRVSGDLPRLISQLWLFLR
jgi:hypothetical protein